VWSVASASLAGAHATVVNTPFLIDSIVRQVTVLLAQLGTAGGLRAPMAHLANQVFLHLAEELETQGVSRKVSADMFGMALRAYIRKVARLREGQSAPGVTLWQAVLQFIREHGLVLRSRVLERFSRDPEPVLASVLHDLGESGLVFVLGSGSRVAYRAASEDELGELARAGAADGLEELVWALVLHEGPLSEAELARRVARPAAMLEATLASLLADGRVERQADGCLSALDLVIPLSSPSGWEAAVFDHFQAVVQTIVQRIERRAVDPAEAIGGSTYRFDIWPGHPLEHRVQAQLTEIRERLSALRGEVSAHNEHAGLPAKYRQVALYVGQCQLDRETDIESEEGSESHAAANEGEKQA
jgi:hypothetical protein